MSADSDYVNLRKAAILLASIGTEAATQICRHLPAETVRRIAEEIARLGPVYPDEQRTTLDEFAKASRRILAMGGLDYARTLLAQTTGDQAALDEEFDSGIDQLRALAESEPHILWRSIQNENPQTIAVIISQLPATKVATILELMDDARRADVAYRAANLGPLAPGTLEALAQSVDSDVVRPESSELEATTSGVGFLLQVFEHLDRSSEKQLLETLATIDDDFANQINDQLVTFESLFALDDRSLQVLLREVDAQVLALALKAADEHQRQQAMENLSTRAQEALREEIEVLGAVKVTDVEAAQKTIVDAARRLDEAGDIALRQEKVDYIE